MDSQNPISLCNVLFVGNLCALIVLILIYGREWNRKNLSRLVKRDWIALIAVAILSGAIAPALVFQALAIAPVNNIILVGRLQPPLTMALSAWLLKERVNRWQVWGAIAAFAGVVLTITLQSPGMAPVSMAGVKVGSGELFAAVSALATVAATFISKVWLSDVPLGIFSIFRTALGTVIFFFVALSLYGAKHFMGVLSPFLWQWMLVYGFVIVVLGQSFWLKGLRGSTITSVSLASSFTPMVGVLAAYLVLGEAPNLAQYIGSSFILVGIILGQVGIRWQNWGKTNLFKAKSPQIAQDLGSGVGFKGM
jgi:drug/metabolite transporter (DMT)-like permease